MIICEINKYNFIDKEVNLIAVNPDRRTGQWNYYGKVVYYDHIFLHIEDINEKISIIPITNISIIDVEW